MPNGKSDIMAKAVYLAQLEAAKNSCECATCRILRKATKSMTEQFLGATGDNPIATGQATPASQIPGSELLTVDEEED